MKFNIFILVICILTGYLISNISEIKIQQQENDVSKLVKILEEWKELDTRR